MDEKLFKVGLEKRKKVLGKEYVENVMSSTTDLNDTFQKAMTEWCWGLLHWFQSMANLRVFFQLQK